MNGHCPKKGNFFGKQNPAYGLLRPIIFFPGGKCMKKSRFELSYMETVRRSIYVFLRDELERRLRALALEIPYRTCRDNKCSAYPYVDPSDMKPKKKEFMVESSVIRPFIVVFCEESIDESHMKYIRFNDDNRIRKDTISMVPSVNLKKSFSSGIKFFEKESFFELLENLMDVDYCLLIQRDERYKKHNSYALTHFHVKIDWPISEAAESLAKELRYVSKSLYEQGERYAEMLEQKLFEYYCCYYQSVGGRRTAALTAAQYMKSLPGLTAVYVSSEESRTLTRYSEKGVGRYAIIQIDKDYATHLKDTYKISSEAFRKSYVLGENDKTYDVTLFVTYKHTEWGIPPADGKLRMVKPDFSWIAVDCEYILPMSQSFTAQPLSVKLVYR